MEIEVPDTKQFGDIIYQQLNGRVRESIIETINSWNVIQKLEDKGLTEFLFSEVVGCSARCPFCRVPCDAHSGGKTQGNHSAILHRPQGLGSYRDDESNCLVPRDCCSSVASNQMFSCSDTDGIFQPYKEYHKWYPDWTIHGNTDPDVEKYWKWVFAQHNRKFAHYYSANPAEIPQQWYQYRTQDIIKDVEDNYHVKLNKEG